MTATPANKVLLFLGTCAILALALNAPLLLKGIVVSWDDYAANLLERIAAGGEFALHGFYHRFPAMLSGIDATVNGIDPKLDTLIFAALPANLAALTFYVLRAFVLVAGLGAILILHYRISAPLALAAAALATQGFNAFNWFYFGPDYAGAAFLFGYQLAPMLVLPSLLIDVDMPSTRRKLASFALSLVAGLIYSLATWFTLVVFTLPLAIVWIALIVRRPAAVWSIAGIVLGASFVTITGVLDFFTVGEFGAQQPLLCRSDHVGRRRPLVPGAKGRLATLGPLASRRRGGVRLPRRALTRIRRARAALPACDAARRVHEDACPADGVTAAAVAVGQLLHLRRRADLLLLPAGGRFHGAAWSAPPAPPPPALVTEREARLPHRSTGRGR